MMDKVIAADDVEAYDVARKLSLDDQNVENLSLVSKMLLVDVSQQLQREKCTAVADNNTKAMVFVAQLTAQATRD